MQLGITRYPLLWMGELVRFSRPQTVPAAIHPLQHYADGGKCGAHHTDDDAYDCACVKAAPAATAATAARGGSTWRRRTGRSSLPENIPYEHHALVNLHVLTVAVDGRV